MNLKVLARPTVEAVSFSWKPNSRIPVKPEDAYVALRAIHHRDQAITPVAVVDSARDPSSPLHAAFEWDDTEAARSYREEQARHLMRSLEITFRKPDGELTRPVRAVVKLVSSEDDPALDIGTEDATQPNVYLPVRQVMTEEAHRRRYVRQALRELSMWRQRYRDIAEFAKLFEVIDGLERAS